MSVAVSASVTQAPSSESAGEIQKYIASYAQAASDPEFLAVALDAANNGIDYLNTRPWLWNMKSDDISLVADTTNYTIPTDVKKPRKMQLLDSSDNEVYHLTWMDPKTFWDTYDDRTIGGDPRHYTMVSRPNLGTVSLDKKPTAAYIVTYPKMRLRYMARISHLADSGNVLDGPPEMAGFVRWYGRWDLACSLDLSASVIDRAERHWRNWWTQLVADDNDVDTDF